MIKTVSLKEKNYYRALSYEKNQNDRKFKWSDV